jgi:ABC-2 type transport system permease protein
MNFNVAETIVLAREIARKSVVLRVRYAFNTAINAVTIYAFFVLLVFIGRQIAPQAITNSLSDIIVGFFVLLMATVAYSNISWELLREARWGTLEQLYMSPLGVGRVVLLTTGINVLVSFVYGVALLALMLLTTDEMLVIDPLTVVPIGLLALGSAVGIGFTLGGLALVFKRIENVLQIIQFTFIVFIATPVERSFILKLLPLSLGSYLLRQSMTEGIPLWKLPMFDLSLLVVKSIVYVAIGYAIFQYAGRIARKRGRLGQY